MILMRKPFLLLLVFCAFITCKKRNEDIPEPASKAAISGSVNLYDEATLPLSNSDMKVSVLGTTPLISVSTDASGKYLLPSVPFGTYTLVYEKTGYGTYLKPGVVHATDGSPTILTNTPSLGKKSTTTITNLTISQNASTILVNASTNPAGSMGNTRYIRYFLSASSAVSKDNYSYASAGLVSRINPYEITLTPGILSTAGFASGQTVYIKVYGDAFWSNEYQDSSTGKKVFPNVNESAASAVSFIVP